MLRTQEATPTSSRIIKAPKVPSTVLQDTGHDVAKREMIVQLPFHFLHISHLWIRYIFCVAIRFQALT